MMKKNDKNISKVYEECIIENVLKRYGIRDEMNSGTTDNKLSKIIEDEFKSEKASRSFTAIS